MAKDKVTHWQMGVTGAVKKCASALSLAESGVRGAAEMVGLSDRQPRMPLLYSISRVGRPRTGAEAADNSNDEDGSCGEDGSCSGGEDAEDTGL